MVHLYLMKVPRSLMGTTRPSVGLWEREWYETQSYLLVFDWILFVSTFLPIQIKRTGASIQAPADQLTFSRSSNASSSGSSPNLDSDYSWVDRLGVWPRRVL